MFQLFCILLMIFHNITADVTDGTELVMSFLVHRHGDRTPIEASLYLSSDSAELQQLSEEYGYGQLTDVGKRRSYDLGKYIRSRYEELLSQKYNRTEVYIRSTDSTRTKMTILSALAAIYPPNGNGWNKNLDWEPVPYTTVPAKYDFNQAMLNCPTYSDGYLQILMSPSPAIAQRYSNVFSVLSAQVGFDISSLPVLAYAIYDIYTSQISLGLPIPAEIEAIWDEVEAAAGAAIDIVFGDEDYIALQAGVLLNEFYTYSAKIIAGEDTQKFRIYSAHDFNVFSFEAVTQITPRQGVPHYTSAYSLEVRKVTDTGKFVVLPVYKPQPDQDIIYLQVKGCDSLLCDYDQFVSITQPYALDVDTWRTKCGFTEDLVIDDSTIA